MFVSVFCSFWLESGFFLFFCLMMFFRICFIFSVEIFFLFFLDMDFEKNFFSCLVLNFVCINLLFVIWEMVEIFSLVMFVIFLRIIGLSLVELLVRKKLYWYCKIVYMVWYIVFCCCWMVLINYWVELIFCLMNMMAFCFCLLLCCFVVFFL